MYHLFYITRFSFARLMDIKNVMQIVILFYMICCF